MPEIKTDDGLFYYEVHGKGEPLLLIAGLGSDSSSWVTVIKILSTQFRTIVFDNRGTGRSDAMQRPYSIGHMAGDVLRLLDHLKIGYAHVIGHSMGGYLAQELAINYPGRVGKLILVSTAPVSSQRNNTLFKDMYSQLKREGCSAAWIKKWISWLFSPRLISDTSFIETFIKNSVEYPYAQKAKGFKGQVEAVASFDARGKIGSIRAKTLILEGKDDILITPQEAGTLAQNIPGSIFRLLDDVAHCIHIENPKLFIDTVLEFLNSTK